MTTNLKYIATQNEATVIEVDPAPIDVTISLSALAEEILLELIERITQNTALKHVLRQGL